MAVEVRSRVHVGESDLATKGYFCAWYTGLYAVSGTDDPEAVRVGSGWGGGDELLVGSGVDFVLCRGEVMRSSIFHVG